MVDDDELELVKALLEFNPKKRLTVDSALRHKFLDWYPKGLGDESIKPKPLLNAIDDNKKMTSHEYKNALFSEINRRRKDAKKESWKVYWIGDISKFRAILKFQVSF